MKRTASEYLDLLQREFVRLEAARRTLGGFVRYQLGKEPARHHEVICDAVDALFNDEYDVLLILTPPNSAKSFYSSVAIPPYFLGGNPAFVAGVKERQIMAISGTADLAQSWGRAARNNCSTPGIRMVFPDLRLAPDSKAADSFTTERGHTYRSFGITSAMLGHRASLLLIDDPISSSAVSDLELKKLHEIYDSTVLSRLEPDFHKGKIILVQQRLARNDLAGYVMDKLAAATGADRRRIKVLTLKMETEAGDPPDGTGRLPGDRLWPERFTAGFVAEMKTNPYRWKTLYQQSPPSDSGVWCRQEWLHLVDEAPPNLNIYMASDIALSPDSGDYSVHIIVGIDHSGRIFVLHAWRAQTGISDTLDQHIDLCRLWGPFESLIEDDNASRVYAVALSDRARQRRVHVPWKSLSIGGKDKLTRAAPLRDLLANGRVFFVRAEWTDWLMSQLLNVGGQDMGPGSDDGLDALGLIGRRLPQLAKPTSPVSAPAGNPAGSFYDAGLDDLHAERERVKCFGRPRF